MRIVQITTENVNIFEVFVQDYEAEFSAVTRKEPDAEGRFALEADWRTPNSGFYYTRGNYSEDQVSDAH